MEMFELKGVYTPIATPFENGEIAYGKLEKNLDFWLGSKLTGIVVMGSNGEFVALHEAEKEELTRFCCKYAAGKRRVIVGTGSNCIDETHHLNRLAAECGADAVLVVTPFYYKNGMKDDILERYFTEVADQSPLPVVLYNMPGNTGVNTSVPLLTKLSKHPNIVGVKDTSGNIAQISETIHTADPSFSVFAGNWAFLLPSLLMGGEGRDPGAGQRRSKRVRGAAGARRAGQAEGGARSGLSPDARQRDDHGEVWRRRPEGRDGTGRAFWRRSTQPAPSARSGRL